MSGAALDGAAPFFVPGASVGRGVAVGSGLSGEPVIGGLTSPSLCLRHRLV